MRDSWGGSFGLGKRSLVTIGGHIKVGSCLSKLDLWKLILESDGVAAGVIPKDPSTVYNMGAC